MRKFTIVMAAAAAMAFGLAACCGNNSKTEAKQEENKMIRLNVTVTADTQNLDTVIYRLNRLAAASREEAGCDGYEIYRNTVIPTQLVIVETWKDQAALDAHAKTPHYATELAAIDGMTQMTLDRFEFSGSGK